MPKTGEKSDREGLYQSECACKIVLAILVGAFPTCPKHGDVEWKLMTSAPA